MDDRPEDEQNDDAEDRTRQKRPSTESVRIIGADEAAAAIEAGAAAGRRPDDAPRFGDVPPAPEGPRPPLRFPMPGSDPAAVAKPPVTSWGGDFADEAELDVELERSPLDEPWEPSDDWATEGGLTDEPAPPSEATAAYEPFADEAELEEPPSPPDAPTLITPGRGVELPHWTEPGTGEVPAILGDAEPAADDEDLAWSSLSSGPRWRDQPSDWEEPDFEGVTSLSDEETRVGALDTGQRDYSDIYSFDEPEPPPPPPPPPPQARPQAPVTAAPIGPADPYAAVGQREGPPRDVRVAISAGLALGALVLVAAKVGAVAVLVLVTAVITAAAFELYETLRTRGYHPATLLGLVGTASMMGAVYWKGEDAMPLVLALFVVFSFLWYLGGVIHARPAMNVAVTVLAFMYVGFLGSFAALLLRIPGVTNKGVLAHDGITLLLLPIVATVAYDVGAYAIGGRAGRTPLAPNVSPNKTWEGLVGATFATFVVTLLLVGVFKWAHPWNAGRAFWLASVVCVAAPLGDLCESMIKRDLGVKDMGTLIPGHGGVLDRIDALLWVVPATYYLIRLLKFA